MNRLRSTLRGHRRAVLIVGIGMTALIGGTRVAASGPGILPATPPNVPAIASFGLRIAPVPAGAPAAVVDETAAERLAASLVDQGTPISAERGVIDAGPSIGPRVAWILFYDGGNPSAVSWGPPGAGAPVIDYTGVAIDDQTGQVLLWLHAGHH
jgi:hypothetical protein